MLTGKLVNKFVRFVFKCYYYLSYRYLNIIISRLKSPGHYYSKARSPMDTNIFSNTEPFEKILIKFWTNNKILDKERVIRMNPHLFRFTMLTKPTYCYVRNK